jgi:hypothetical protein
MIGAAAPGAVALVREVRRVLSFSGTGSAAISAAKSLLQVAVDVVAAGSAMLSRRVGRVLSTTAAGALTYTRQVGRALAHPFHAVPHADAAVIDLWMYRCHHRKLTLCEEFPVLIDQHPAAVKSQPAVFHDSF